MIKVGYLLNVSNSWLGGLNYMYGLIDALKKSNSSIIEPYIFISKDTPDHVKLKFSEVGLLVETNFMTRGKLAYYIWKITRRLFKTDLILEFFLKKYNLDLISHSDVFGLRKLKSLNWIPDLQHKFLSKMFDLKEIEKRDKIIDILLSKSDTVLLSSYQAESDLKQNFNTHNCNLEVLQFIPRQIDYLKSTSNESRLAVNDKYNISESYFFFPSQLWQHKNHICLLKALKHLKDTFGAMPLVVFTGHLEDYRNLDHSKEILNFIKYYNLNVKLLGVIAYEELNVLMVNSIAVISPSLFEGWSSIVEECKSIGKELVLSDIKVHREQNPAKVHFFSPNDYLKLSEIILGLFSANLCEYYAEDEFNYFYNKNREIFVSNYIRIINNTLNLR
jgi:hypothetical protein